MPKEELDSLVNDLAKIYVTASINRKPAGAGDFAKEYLKAKNQIKDVIVSNWQN